MVPVLYFSHGQVAEAPADLVVSEVVAVVGLVVSVVVVLEEVEPAAKGARHGGFGVDDLARRAALRERVLAEYPGRTGLQPRVYPVDAVAGAAGAVLTFWAWATALAGPGGF